MSGMQKCNFQEADRSGFIKATPLSQKHIPTKHVFKTKQYLKKFTRIKGNDVYVYVCTINLELHIQVAKSNIQFQYMPKF